MRPGKEEPVLFQFPKTAIAQNAHVKNEKEQ
jgi:hypothetical protein